MSMVLTLCFGAVFGYILYRCKLPGGMMVGAIVGVALLNVVWGGADMRSWARILAQLAAGAYIGCSVERQDVLRMGGLMKPFVLVIFNYFLLNMTAGFLLTKISPLDSITALLSSIPGGMTDLPIIAMDMHADAPKVAALQFVRMLVGVGVFPSLIVWASKREPQRHRTEPERSSAVVSPKKPAVTLKTALLTFGAALAGGLLGRWMGIPAGILLMSMVGVIVLKLCGAPAGFPPKVKIAAQLLSGSYIGSLITQRDILELRTLIFPALLILLLYLLNCICTGWLLKRFFGFTLREGMLISTPAGATDIALITSDMGLDNPDITVMQTFRMMVAISFFPQMALFFSKFM